jgi:hypothetical protein
MRWCLTLATLVTITPFASAVTHAQQSWAFEKEEPRPKRIDISVSTGLQLSTDWSDLVVLGTLGGLVEHVLTRNLAFAPGNSYGLTVTYWEGRYGFRVNAGMARSCLAVGGGCRSFTIPNGDATNGDERIVVGNIDANAYSLDIGGAIAFVAPGKDVPFRPFFFFGAGGLSYDMDEAVRFLLPSFIELGGTSGRIGQDRDGRVKVITDGSPFLVSVGQPGFELLFAGILGLGVDFRVPLGQASLGLRFEVSDHITRSPLEVRLAGFVDDFHFSRTEIEDVRFDFGLVHNMQLSVGLVLNAPLRHTAPPTRSSSAARH